MQMYGHFEGFSIYTWRIIPVSQWLGTNHGH